MASHRSPYAKTRHEAVLSRQFSEHPDGLAFDNKEFHDNNNTPAPRNVVNHIRSYPNEPYGAPPHYCPTFSSEEIFGFQLRGQVSEDVFGQIDDNKELEASISCDILAPSFNELGINITIPGLHFIPVEIVATSLSGTKLPVDFPMQIELVTGDDNRSWYGRPIPRKAGNGFRPPHTGAWTTSEHGPVKLYDIDKSKLTPASLRWLCVDIDSLHNQLNTLVGTDKKLLPLSSEQSMITDPFNMLMVDNMRGFTANSSGIPDLDRKVGGMFIDTDKAREGISALTDISKQKDLCMDLSRGIGVKFRPAIGGWHDILQQCTTSLLFNSKAPLVYYFSIMVYGVARHVTPLK